MSLITQNQIDAIEQGAKFLDGAVPNWAQRINPSSLDINEFNTCVIGQLYGNYFDGKELLGLDTARAIALGFSPDDDEMNSGDPNAVAAERTKEWLKQVRARVA